MSKRKEAGADVGGGAQPAALAAKQNPGSEHCVTSNYNGGAGLSVGAPLPLTVSFPGCCDANAHPRDRQIRLDETRHVYEYTDGQGVLYEFSISVSGIWAKYFARFNPQVIVDTYFLKWSQDVGSKYHAQIAAGRLVNRNDEDLKQDIIDAWKANGADASSRGTYMHKQIELALGRFVYDDSPPEMQHFVRWVSEVPERMCWQVYRTEWSIFSLEALVAGQIDAIFRDTEGKFHMVDWKRCKEPLLQDAKIQFGRFGMSPLEDMVDNEWSHYVVQQNLYATILRREYDFILESMALVRCHPDAETYQHVHVPGLCQEVVWGMLEANRGHLTRITGAHCSLGAFGGG